VVKLQGQRRLGGQEKGQSHIFSRMAFSITNPQVENFAFQTIYDRMLFAKLMMQFLVGHAGIEKTIAAVAS